MYPQVFGKYVLERELATGGMARVLLATLRGAGGFEKKLVVKQIRDELAVDHEFVQRFVEEAKTTVALSHPNIVPVYELGIEMGTYYLAMELVDGVSVDVLLRKREGGGRDGLSPEEGAYLGAEVCRALDYAHRRMQVVHRDITPRNVMVDEEGQVKVIDFGIAARASVAGHDVFGTPGHMPPEQMRREEIGPSTDIFAVAVLLMELWSGQAPFRRKTPGESLAQMHSPHPKPSDTDPRLQPLDDIIGRAMSLSPKERPQQAEELGRVLRKFVQDKDQGDLERGLGERVREARAEATRRATSRVNKDGSLVKPSKPSMPDMGPKTFAVRSEALAWKAETPEEPNGTRKLPQSQPPPAMPPEGATERMPDSEPPKLETIATRPLETPVTREPVARPAGEAGAAWKRWAMGAFFLLPITAWGVLRVQTPGPSPGLPSSVPLPVPVPAGVADAAVTSVPVPPEIGSGSGAAATTASGMGSGLGTVVHPAPSVTAVTPAATGQLILVGDPGTTVAIDGSPPRPCPAAITVKTGAHLVRFSFGYATTHDAVEQRIVVGTGEKITLRADFTAAVPRVRVEH